MRKSITALLLLATTALLVIGCHKNNSNSPGSNSPPPVDSTYIVPASPTAILGTYIGITHYRDSGQYVDSIVNTYSFDTTYADTMIAVRATNDTTMFSIQSKGNVYYSPTSGPLTFTVTNTYRDGDPHRGGATIYYYPKGDSINYQNYYWGGVGNSYYTYTKIFRGKKR